MLNIVTFGKKKYIFLFLTSCNTNQGVLEYSEVNLIKQITVMKVNIIVFFEKTQKYSIDNLLEVFPCRRIIFLIPDSW